MDTEFAQCEKMLYKLAWRAVETYGLTFSEALSEVGYGFVKAFNWRFKPGRGHKLSTCACSIASWRLHQLVIDRTTAMPTVEIDDELVGHAPATHSPSLEIVEEMSADAKEIIHLLLETPAEILGQAPVPITHLLKRVKAYLVSKGRSKDALDIAHSEIKQRFQEAWA